MFQGFRVSAGDILVSQSSGYVVDSFLGEGSFGKVAKCFKTATMEWVAVKIIKDHPVLVAQAEQEVKQKALGLVKYYGICIYSMVSHVRIHNL